MPDHKPPTPEGARSRLIVYGTHWCPDVCRSRRPLTAASWSRWARGRGCANRPMLLMPPVFAAEPMQLWPSSIAQARKIEARVLFTNGRPVPRCDGRWRSASR
jgi:hypothetical protein